MITQERLKQLLVYNEEQGEFIWKVKPHKGILINTIAGSKHNKGYRHIRVDNKLYLTHRLVWLYIFGYFPKEIDHINGNKEDNRLINLREATRAQNMQNTERVRKTVSGERGVTWVKKLKKWLVRVQIDKKRINIGYFEDLELAILVSQEAKRKYYGEFYREKE